MSLDERTAWVDRIGTLSAGGKKVIGCASLETTEVGTPSDVEPDRGYKFAGLLAFSDPLRSGVARAVAQALRAGIRIIMVTGDHKETAMAIAREAGIPSACVTSGDEMELMLANASPALQQLSIVSRAMPQQKLALVQALQRQGEIVAVTGDGVNDVPALRAADIGIAMGMRGTKSAREVAAIILLDDNFRTIVGAIAEGRQLFHNLKQSFNFLLMVHIPLVATAAIIPLLGYPLLYLPVHIVWLELIIHPGALLGFQQSSHDRLDVRSGETRFFRPSEWLAITITGVATACGLLFLYFWMIKAGHGADHARTVTLVALIMAEAGILTALTRLRGKAPKAIVAGTILSAFAFAQIPPLASLLFLHPLGLREWLVAASAGFLFSAASTWLSSLSTHSPDASADDRHIGRSPRASA
jgi:Ca2+-transporting ATPase